MPSNQHWLRDTLGNYGHLDVCRIQTDASQWSWKLRSSLSHSVAVLPTVWYFKHRLISSQLHWNLTKRIVLRCGSFDIGLILQRREQCLVVCQDIMNATLNADSSLHNRSIFQTWASREMKDGTVGQSLIELSTIFQFRVAREDGSGQFKRVEDVMLQCCTERQIFAQG